MSLERNVRFDFSRWFRLLLGDAPRERHVAAEQAARLRSEKKTVAAKVARPVKPARKEKPAETARQDQIAQDQAAVEEAARLKAESQEILAACVEESLVAEGYVTNWEMTGEFPIIRGENLAGEHVSVALDGDSASYKLKGFKGDSCADLAARLDAQMARRGLVITEESTESDASESSSEAQARERRQGCPRR